MTKLQKFPQNKVEREVGALPPEDAEQFWNLVRSNATQKAIAEWFAERDVHVSLGQVSTWWKRNRPRGKEMITLNAWAEQFRGANEDELLELSAGLTANLVKLLYDDYDPNNVSGNVKLQSLLEAIRELRQITEVITGKRQLREESHLEFSGALQLRKYLEATFTETSFEDPLMIAMDAFFEDKFNELG